DQQQYQRQREQSAGGHEIVLGGRERLLWYTMRRPTQAGRQPSILPRSGHSASRRRTAAEPPSAAGDPDAHRGPRPCRRTMERDGDGGGDDRTDEAAAVSLGRRAGAGGAGRGGGAVGRRRASAPRAGAGRVRRGAGGVRAAVGGAGGGAGAVAPGGRRRLVP